MACCEENPKKLHTVVPQTGPAGDSTGYFTVAVEPDEPFYVRQRWHFPFIIALVSADGVPADGIKIRKALTAADLQEKVFMPFEGSASVLKDETVEIEVSTKQPGAVLGFQVIKQG